MDFYKKRTMVSRQGKAINHLHSSYFATPIKRKPPKKRGIADATEIDLLLSNLEKTPKEQPRPEPPSKALSSSFKAISREKQDFVFRNKTESPNVGSYNPNWQAVRPRSAQTPKISVKKTRPRRKMIFTPLCITADLNCSYPVRNQIDSGYNEKLKRTMSNLQAYMEKADEKQAMRKDSDALSKTTRSFVGFDKQLDRKEFVKSDPSYTNRPLFTESFTGIYSKNKHVKSVLFAKSTPRSEVFPPKQTVGPYDKDEEKLRPKLSISLFDMGKMTDRKELVLTHMLETPYSLDVEDYDKAFYKQSTVRGAFSIPLMSKAAPRDDMMYRTSETYMLNIPEIQSADAKPKYMGDTSLRFYKAQLVSAD